MAESYAATRSGERGGNGRGAILELNESDIEHLMVDLPKGPRNNEAVITQDRLDEVDPDLIRTREPQE